jgi:hypothetical protein
MMQQGFPGLASPKYVHYAKAPIVGEWVVPWDQLSDDLRAIAGHEARVYEKRLREQWRSDRVFVHELPDGSPFFNIGTTYATAEYWVYEVDPVPPFESDPEWGGHLPTSRTCARARVVSCLYQPDPVAT